MNLSLGGLCFKSPRLLRSPQVVKLRLALDSTSMAVSAAVRHAAQAVADLNAGPPGAQFVIGVQFVDVSADDRESLKKQLEQLAKERKLV